MSSKAKSTVPVDLAARVLFRADRTCCVCRTPGKAVQLHHIDENPSNSIERNLAVLCLECHTDTQVRGGFHRKLDGDQVTLYRDDWNQIVALRRAAIDAKALESETERSIELKSLTTTLDILKEHQQFWLLAVNYDAIGNSGLRDKYIEKALQEDGSDDSVIFLRSLQGRQDLIPREAITREVRRRDKHSDWSQLARLYERVGDHRNAVVNYCKTVMRALEEGRTFSAAFYLKELSETQLYSGLLQAAYREATQKGDLWWRIRALQELGWDDELKSILVEHRAEIERSDNSLMLIELYRATGEMDKLLEERRRMFERERLGSS